MGWFRIQTCCFGKPYFQGQTVSFRESTSSQQGTLPHTSLHWTTVVIGQLSSYINFSISWNRLESLLLLQVLDLHCQMPPATRFTFSWKAPQESEFRRQVDHPFSSQLLPVVVMSFIWEPDCIMIGQYRSLEICGGTTGIMPPDDLHLPSLHQPV